jgi:hypothetical protein
MPRSVALVFNPDFGDRLERLAFRMPAWIVDTEENRAAAEAVWHMAQEWPQISVTLFRATASAVPQRDEWSGIIEQVELHHGSYSQRVAYDTLDVVGTQLTQGAREAFEAAGFQLLETTADGFRATKLRG